MFKRGTRTNIAVFLSTDNSANVIDRNNITTNGSLTTIGENIGIILVGNSSRTNVTNNRIMTNSSASASSTPNYGIWVENVTEGLGINYFDGNNITALGT